MSRRVPLCPIHNMPRMSIFGHFCCAKCKRGENKKSRDCGYEAKRLAATRRALQKAADEALDVRVERVWREKRHEDGSTFEEQEALYYGRTA